MAQAANAVREKVKEYTFIWEGKDKVRQAVKGDMRAGGEHVVLSALRRQGIAVLKVKRQKRRHGREGNRTRTSPCLPANSPP